MGKVSSSSECEIKIPKMELVKIQDLKVNPRNVKKHPESQINGLKELIKLEGFISPLVIDKNNLIWVGHGRIIAAKELGMMEVPCVRLENLTKKQFKAIMLMDNKINESAWDEENVGFILEELGDFDFEEFEMNFDEFRIDEEVDEDEILEAPKKPKSKLGDIYQLGNHRIMCGDATKDIEKLIEDDIDLLLTDPPYGISAVNVKGVTGGGGKLGFIGGKGVVDPRKYKQIIGDDKPFDPIHLLKYGVTQIIFGANNFASKLTDRATWLVWDKKDNRGSESTTFSDVELAWINVKKGKICRIYRHLWSGLLREGGRKTELKERVHPTQKPVGLLSEIIKDYSKENHTVLDCYLGSGSTLIACEKTNRICYGMELDPAYIDVIIERWENYTGKKAKKLKLNK